MRSVVDVFRLLVILGIFHFDFDARTWFLIAPVPCSMFFQYRVATSDHDRCSIALDYDQAGVTMIGRLSCVPLHWIMSRLE